MMDIFVTNLPDFKNQADEAVFKSRISNLISDMLTDKYKVKNPRPAISSAKNGSPVLNGKGKSADNEDADSTFFIEAQEPQYTFGQIVLADEVFQELQYAIKFENVRSKVYDEWGLAKIEPCPKLALNFHGPSGTGKTMAAHGIAQAMGRKIILASYAEIESKYHGDGPKNVKKLFQTASDTNAVLFIDEADSLLSKRLTNVTQGSEQAINSMRSQLLIQIEQFSGIVIFATNLACNYDNAFVTRIKNIQFTKPDQEMRKKLWKTMLLPQLPLDSDIDMEELSSIEDVCGRDIKNAVVKAAVKTAIDNESHITQKNLYETLCAIVESNRQVTGNLSESEKAEIGKKIQRKLHKDTIRKRGIYRHR
jgi:ATP-dependent 26S proteasome regulatory subunit